MANIGIKLAAKPHPLLLDFNEEFKGDTKESQSCSMVFFWIKFKPKGFTCAKTTSINMQVYMVGP